jgi:hypothetical protein
MSEKVIRRSDQRKNLVHHEGHEEESNARSAKKENLVSFVVQTFLLFSAPPRVHPARSDMSLRRG